MCCNKVLHISNKHISINHWHSSRARLAMGWGPAVVRAEQAERQARSLPQSVEDVRHDKMPEVVVSNQGKEKEERCL